MIRIFFCVSCLSAAALPAMDEVLLKENDALRQVVSGGEKEAEDKKKADKSIYNLFRPVPKDLLREMSTDRPDQTESAITLDAGHFQMETTLFGFTLDERSPGRVNRRVKEYEFWNTNYKVGLFNNADFQVVIPAYTVQRTTEKGRAQILQGFGDVTLRGKINLKNNDGDGPSVAILPFIKLPTNQDGLGNKYVEGGLIVPWGVELPKGWSNAGQIEFDLFRNDSGRAYHGEYGGTYNFGHEIVKKLSGYLEFAAFASTENHSRWVGTYNTGIVYEISDNIHLDASVNIGLTRSANDFKTFLGFSVRF